jgi:DNA polymerase-3 subunit beta
LPVDSFPKLPEVTGEACTFNGLALTQAIAKTRCAVTAAQAKHALQGALLEKRGAGAVMVATDGKRLSLASLAFEGEALHMIIPMKTLDMIVVLAGMGDITITTGPRHLFFSINGRLLLSRMFEAQFPAYEKILPGDTNRVLSIDCSVAAAALKRVSLAAEDNKAVYFTFAEASLHMTTRSSEAGEAEETTAAQYEGQPLKICTNGEHVLDFLDAAVSPTIEMRLSDARGAKKSLLLVDGTDHMAVVSLMSGATR